MLVMFPANAAGRKDFEIPKRLVNKKASRAEAERMLAI